MKPIVDLALRSEYSFRQTFGKIEDIVGTAKTKYIGVADFNNTFSHVVLEKECKKKGIKPIFGVRLEVLCDTKKRIRGACGPVYIFIAKNNSGLYELNKLVTTAWENFYYKPMIFQSDVDDLSDDVFVIAENIEDEDLRLDFLALSPSTPYLLLNLDKPKVYVNNNYFISPDDRKVYQLMAGAVKRGDEYNYKFDTKRAFQHILTTEEFHRIYNCHEAIENTYKIAEQCSVVIPKANMVKYTGSKNIITECSKGAKKKGIDIINDGEYKARFEREIELIVKKEYVDYFMIVADMIEKAKKTMFVGPSRGSSAGSLVCYLLGITEVDPIKFGLIFERFIDINREDLPDIDIDFPDEGRDQVIKNTFKTYGKDNVCHIANINKFAARSALEEVGIALRIPRFEMDILKDSIVDRSGGDARAKISIQDTLHTTQVGKDMLYKYPALQYAEKMQNHATHAGKHAAGIIVCNEDLCKYGAINVRDGSIMMDKKGAEYLNLLKIDALGLRTLSILQECARLIGMDYHDYYTMPLDDQKTFQIFNAMRLNGIFQFEGQAMRMLCENMGVENFEDIVVITALARPGPLHSGGANKFAARRTGKEEVEYISNNPIYIRNTEETYGVIVYQEQLMNLCRDLGKMSWEDVSEIRKAASKTLGKEFFDKYRAKFMTGALENGLHEEEATEVWENMMTFGCLSGDTIIKLPGANQYSPKKITLRELYENKGYGKPAVDYDNAVQQKKRGLSKIWMYDFEKEKCIPTRPIEIVQSGIKETFELKTNKSSIRATADHKFLTKNGWKKLSELNIGDEVATLGKSITNQRRTDRVKKHKDESWRFNKRKPYDGRSTEFELSRDKLIENNPFCACCGVAWEETHHKDGNRENNNISNIELLCRKCHKQRHRDMGDKMPYPYMNGKKINFDKIISIGNSKYEMTYDICMPDPNNNFEANNFIVHNSWGMNKCLASGTKVRLAHGNQIYGKDCTIDQLYRDYVENPSPWILQNNRMPVLLSYSNGRINKQMAKSIIKSGAKDCYKYTLSNGKFFECTKEHKFIVNGNWVEIGIAKIGDLILSVAKKNYKYKSTGNSPKGKTYSGHGFQDKENNPAYINGKTECANKFRNMMIDEPCQDCLQDHDRMEIHHNDFNKGFDRPDDLSWLCPGCHKKRHYDNSEKYPYSKGFDTYELEIVNIEHVGIKETYDIEMPDIHNFVLSSGPITHNSHTVSYGLISYWCAYMKAHHPLEFMVANLRHTKNERSTLLMLRDAYENENIDYIPVDPDNSEVDWTVHDGKLLGGLSNIIGVGEKKAKEIMLCRTGKKKWTPSMVRNLMEPKTPYDTLYPCWDRWHDIYEKPRDYGLAFPPSYICDVKKPGIYVIIGLVLKKDLRDLNEYNEVMKRGGKVYETNNKALKFVIEDDTGQIHASISRMKFDELNGSRLSESLVEEKSWVIIRGKIQEGWRVLMIEQIFDLNNLEK